MSNKLDPMKILESLTPGGSEYYNDAQRCYETIRHYQEMLMQQLHISKRKINDLQDVLEYVLACCSILPDDTPENVSVVFGHPSSEQWSRIVLAARKAKYRLEGKI